MGIVASKIKAQFENSAEARKPLLIPEWEITVYMGPWTWGQAVAVQELAESGSIDFLRKIIEIKAKDEHGRPAFDADDISEMKTRGDPGLIKRIGNELLKIYPLSFESEKK